MLQALDGRADGQPGRHLWIEFEIHLSEKNPEDRDAMVGGICFDGYPYLPYHVTPAGQNSANLGLPHEIRVSWKEQERIGFIDDEDAVTLQLPAAHAGFHTIRTRPLRTRVLRLRIGDFPRLLIKNRSREPEDLLREFWGFLITQLYVFEHEERMQYEPEIAGALVGAYQTPPSFARGYVPELEEPQYAPLAARLSGLAPDYLHLVEADGLCYAPFSAASLFAGPRPYRVQSGGSRDGREIFLSNAVGAGDEVRIVFAQTDSNERCLAGIRITGPGPKLPLGLALPLAPFRYGVYELDTLEGASPLRFDAPDADKYALRLASGVIKDPASLRPHTIRFDRPSLGRFFVLVLTAQAEKAYVGLARIELIQSASVVLAARPARAIRVDRMHFRLRGPELASDFARLGEKGMGLRLDFLQGDQRRQTLLEAHSLLDLLDLGARLHRNSRHLEVRRELSESRSRTRGWSRSETGDGVAWESGGAQQPVDDRPPLPDHGGEGFDSFGTQGIRTHTEHVGFEGELARDLRDQVVRINRLLRRIPNVGDNEFVNIPPVGVHRLTDGFTTFWRGIPEENVQTIRGLYNLNVPPHSAAAPLAETVLDLFSGGLANPALPTDLTDFVTDLFPTLLLRGLTASIGGSFYGSVSISSGQMIPSASRVTTTGETGVVVRSATTTPYHYCVRQSLEEEEESQMS